MEAAGPSNNIVLELKADGSYEINGNLVAYATLDAEFHRIYDNRPAKILFVKSAGNRLRPWGGSPGHRLHATGPAAE